MPSNVDGHFQLRNCVIGSYVKATATPRPSVVRNSHPFSQEVVLRWIVRMIVPSTKMGSVRRSEVFVLGTIANALRKASVIRATS
jgi:hypothetical protein